jgi:hypothetical protein
VKWKSSKSGKDKVDNSLKNFLFTLKNPHNIRVLISFSHSSTTNRYEHEREVRHDVPTHLWAFGEQCLNA